MKFIKCASVVGNNSTSDWPFDCASYCVFAEGTTSSSEGVMSVWSLELEGSSRWDLWLAEERAGSSLTCPPQATHLPLLASDHSPLYSSITRVYCY